MAVNLTNESSIDLSKIWYFGNNRAKNLRVSKPLWNYPFFLTDNFQYAMDYADYGVYKIELASERDLRILDFSSDEEVRLLRWPEVLVRKIQAGLSDLNSIAYDLYILAYGEGRKSPTYVEDTEEWRLASYVFRDKSIGVMDYAASGSVWGSEEDHQFLLLMWKDIHDAGFDGFTHVEFGNRILALFNLKCIEKISAYPIDANLDEKLKNRIIKKKFKTKGQAAFPEIKSDGDIMFVSDIPKDKALWLLRKACHDVSNFHPEYMEKAVKWSNDRIFGVFNKHDKRNVLALASVSYDGNESGAAYLHEMTGFIGGGYGKKLVIWLMQKFKKIYGLIALDGTGTEDDPYRPNEKLKDRFYATIPGMKIYRVENSCWDCPADFFYYGISDDSIRDFLEDQYGKKDLLNESKNDYLRKHLNEPDVDAVVDKFWNTIRHRVQAPLNDINWWMKKPYTDFKRFVIGFDTRNRNERRDNDYRVEAMNNDAKLLGERDGFEIWYVPTYEAMRILGRFYKGISTEWCVASEDPSFWFDIHDRSEFIVLVRKDPHHDEFDKIAIEMQNGGRSFNVDDFIMWDVENEDDRFCNDSLMHYAWELFIDNGERRKGL